MPEGSVRMPVEHYIKKAAHYISGLFKQPGETMLPYPEAEFVAGGPVPRTYEDKGIMINKMVNEVDKNIRDKYTTTTKSGMKITDMPFDVQNTVFDLGHMYKKMSDSYNIGGDQKAGEHVYDTMANALYNSYRQHLSPESIRALQTLFPKAIQ